MKYSSFQGDRGEKGDKVRCSFVREHISSSSFHASFLSSSSFLSSPPFPFLLHPLLPLSLHLFLPFLPINLFRSYFIPLSSLSFILQRSFFHPLYRMLQSNPIPSIIYLLTFYQSEFQYTEDCHTFFVSIHIYIYICV